MNPLAKMVVSTAREKGLTLSVAESCTGGGLGQALTAIPGSSSVFRGGIIAYANRVKSQQLGITNEMLETHGAVSATVAQFMAENACTLFQTDFCLSITGIAGPGGATEFKPVGRVYLALNQAGHATKVYECDFGAPGRDKVRNLAIEKALNILQQALSET